MIASTLNLQVNVVENMQLLIRSLHLVSIVINSLLYNFTDFDLIDNVCFVSILNVYVDLLLKTNA